MLTWIVLFVIAGYLLACATVIVTSCYKLIQLIHWTPNKPRPFTRIIRV